MTCGRKKSAGSDNGTENIKAPCGEFFHGCVPDFPGVCAGLSCRAAANMKNRFFMHRISCPGSGFRRYDKTKYGGRRICRKKPMKPKGETIMSKTAILTDSCCDLTKEVVTELGIYVIPIELKINGKK